MERDWSLMKLQISLTISTHTLTWSVTLAEIYNKGTWKISTHTLTWSVTADPKSNSRSYGYFNSHAHVERDTPSIVVEEALKISTHTLTWSVTQREKALPFMINISTHTLTWSVTKTYGQVRACISISTHTLTWSVTARLMHHLK